MRRSLAVLAMLLLLPAAAFASHDAVNVNVRVGGGTGWSGDDAWIEFRPDCGAFVAIYAAFSDGSLELVFPTAEDESHWIDRDESRVVRVSAPCGVSLEHVQAIASPRWFDPSECWVAWDDGFGWAGPRVVVASSISVVSWGCRVAWSAPHRSWRVVQRCSWDDPVSGEATLSAARWKADSWDRWGGSVEG